MQTRMCGLPSLNPHQLRIVRVVAVLRVRSKVGVDDVADPFDVDDLAERLAADVDRDGVIAGIDQIAGAAAAEEAAAFTTRPARAHRRRFSRPQVLALTATPPAAWPRAFGATGSVGACGAQRVLARASDSCGVDTVS